MNPWRSGLLATTLALTSAGWLWMWVRSAPGLRTSLLLLLAVFVMGSAVAFWQTRDELNPRAATAHLALGSLMHLVAAGLVVGGDRLMQLGLVPALANNWLDFVIGLLGTGAAAFTWSRARPGPPPQPPAPAVGRSTERPPAPSPELDAPVPWEDHAEQLLERDDTVRARQLEALRRLDRLLADPALSVEDVRRALRQEVRRLLADSAAAEREAEEGDVLSVAAAFLEWGAQKLPEIAELDVSDLMMAKAIADIRAQHSEIEHVFVDHRKLAAIHPIDRPSADAKCNERADAARAALPLLVANGMQLSEELIAAHDELAAFRSVTGFQVVELADGRFLTFEGNGRREALQRAFGDEEGVAIEVRLYRFDDPSTAATIQRRVERVRDWKGVDADE